MLWSGNQNAQGFELQNFRDETVAGLPAYSSPTDAGRYLFVTTPGPDYGIWIGSESAGTWIRPNAFSGLAEAGLMMYVDPEVLVEAGGWGFLIGTPAALITHRALTPAELIVLEVVTAAAEEGLIATVAPSAPFGPTTFLTDFYFTPAGAIVPPYNYTGFLMAELNIIDSVTAVRVDKMSIIVDQI